ncbi:hypothetical protein PRIPAC_87259 [Pristionchus pacificus]|uniref:Uncharacterized protein n=1 Tax=Pristionchus pacificus TaxID=54126 RepID=A0A2A6B3J9_PRIPA|nr:hypothetical protein PRIPAC_87259 [Pristionchus pacificus]|eukprot:PDM60450.1 hypothetical protein PRIPAC_53428 [Pristionchus pacificus]
MYIDVVESFLAAARRLIVRDATVVVWELEGKNGREMRSIVFYRLVLIVRDAGEGLNEALEWIAKRLKT